MTREDSACTNGRTCHATHSHHQHVIDIFLFVNPFSKTCLDAEKELLRFVQETPFKVFFRLVCFSDLQHLKIQQEVELFRSNSVETFNSLSQQMYRIALGYKAALLQGKKLGRAFLMTIQQEYLADPKHFSLATMIRYVKQSALDYDMWYKDFHSKRVLEDYRSDIRFARQNHIECQPSLIISDNFNYHYGLRVNCFMTSSDLHQLVEHMISGTVITEKNGENTTYSKNKRSKNCIQLLKHHKLKG